MSEVGPPVSGRGWRFGYPDYVLLMLILMYMLQYIDRSVVPILAQPVKAEFGLTDRTVGLVVGFVFTVPLGLMLVPAGYMADRGNRRNILSIALVVWSLLTFVSGFARNLWQLAAIRALVAAAEAFFVPNSQALIADYYDRTKRATALSRVFIATALAIFVGVPLVAGVANAYGWRAGFFIAGAPGLILGIIFFLTVREPRRGSSDGITTVAPPPSLRQAFRIIKRQPSAIHVAWGMTVNTMVFAAFSAWTMPFLMRVHGMSLSDAGWVMSVAYGGAAAVGYLFGGVVIDHLGRRDARWFAAVPGGLVLIGLLSMQTTSFATSRGILIGSIAMWSLINAVVVGPSIAVVQNLIPPQMRGLVAGGTSVLLNTVGAGLGPLIAGGLSDMFAADYGTRSISMALAVAALLQLWAALHFFWATRTINADIARIDSLSSET